MAVWAQQVAEKLWPGLATLIVLGLGCSFDGSTPSASADDPSDGGVSPASDARVIDQDASLAPGTFRKSIEMSPQGLSEDLSDFVVAVLLDSDSDLAARAQTDGTDIRFQSASGEALDYEVEEFESATGKLVAWVRLPTLSATTATTIYLYYGEVVVTHDPAKTWSTAFTTVWHFAEDPSVDAPVFTNSVSAKFSATASGNNRPTRASGIAGYSLSFDGFNDQVGIEGSPSSELDFGTESFSLSMWLYVSNTAGSYDMPWYKGAANSGDTGYDFELGSGGWSGRISDGSDLVGSLFGNVSDFDAIWVHLVMVVNREAQELRVYANGSRKDTDDISGIGSLTTSKNARLGTQSYPFEGLIDEMRVYKRALGDDWIRLEHANISAPGTFFVLGDQEGSALPQ